MSLFGDFETAKEEEAALFDRYGLSGFAAQMRAAKTLKEAGEVHENAIAVLRVAKIMKAAR